MVRQKGLTPLNTNLKYVSSDYETISYLSSREIQNLLLKSKKEVLDKTHDSFYLSIVILTIIFLVIVKNKPIYRFIQKTIFINNKEFNLIISSGKIHKWAESNTYNVYVPGRVEKNGNTEIHYEGYYTQRTDYKTYVYFNGKPVPWRYKIFEMKDGLRAVKFMTKKHNIAFYYPDRKRLKSSYRDFWIMVFKTVGIKVRILPLLLSIILSLASLVSYLKFQSISTEQNISLLKGHIKVFDYNLSYFNFKMFDTNVYVIEFLKFTILILIIYIAVQLLKQAWTIMLIHLKLRKHMIKLVENGYNEYKSPVGNIV